MSTPSWIGVAACIGLILASASPSVAGPNPPEGGRLVDTDRIPETVRVPFDHPTIQAAIDAAGPWDTIVIGPGQFDEALVVRKRNGLTIKGSGATNTTIRSSDTVLRVLQSANVRVEGIRFETAAEQAIEANSSSLAMWFNVVVAESPTAQIDLTCARVSEFVRNTFVRPDASGGPFLEVHPSPCLGAGRISVRRNLFWTWGKPIADETGQIDIVQNTLGMTDLSAYPSENLGEFPLFCDPGEGDYTLGPTSPCLPDNNPYGRTIGALGAGCGAIGVEPTSWGEIKASYR